MRILLIADLRSPIAQSWAATVSRSHTVHVASSHVVDDHVAPAVGRSVVPFALSGGAPGIPSATPGARVVAAARRRPGVMRLASSARSLVAPLEVRRYGQALRAVVDEFGPDVVHALRIPYEGIAAAYALRSRKGPPLALSIWGNDLTLHASRNPLISTATRQTLYATAGLHTDCHRDQQLATAWGWGGDGPTLVAPGSGGLDLGCFRPGASDLRDRHGIEAGAPVVLNPRGLREYVRTDVYLAALPRILHAVPDVFFVSTGISQLGKVAELEDALRKRLVLLPSQSMDQMADVYRAAALSVSPSLHDGTPNTLLEAMATGCLPVIHPVASVMEWVEHGVNGLVIDANSPKSVADGIIRGLQDAELRTSAARINRRLVVERADRLTCAPLITDFYERVAAG